MMSTVEDRKVNEFADKAEQVEQIKMDWHSDGRRSWWLEIMLTVPDKAEQVGEGRLAPPPLWLCAQGDGSEGGEGPVPRHNED